MENNNLKEIVRKSVKEKIAISNVRKELNMKYKINRKMFYYITSSVAVFVLGIGIILGTNILNNKQIKNEPNKVSDLRQESKSEKEENNVELNINNLKTISQTKLDADVKIINNIDVIKVLENVIIPNDMNGINDIAIYVKSENSDKYDKLYNYEFSYFNTENNLRNIKIAFSNTNKPLRDYYFEDNGKISKINDIELKIYKYEDSYIVFFNARGYEFDIETSGITEEELLILLSSIINTNTKDIADEDANVREWGNSNIDYKDYYAGKYVDDNGNNVILLCEDNAQNRKDICSLLGITESKTIFKTAKYSYNYLLELQNKISDKMARGELKFVMSSALMEDSNNIKVCVTSKEDLNQLIELDTLGGAIDIQYGKGETLEYKTEKLQ